MYRNRGKHAQFHVLIGHALCARQGALRRSSHSLCPQEFSRSPAHHSSTPTGRLFSPISCFGLPGPPNGQKSTAPAPAARQRPLCHLGPFSHAPIPKAPWLFPGGAGMRLWVPGESPGGILGPRPFPTARANPSTWHIRLPTVTKVPCLCVPAPLSPPTSRAHLVSAQMLPQPSGHAHSTRQGPLLSSGRSAFPFHGPSAPCTGLGQVYTPARPLVMSRRAGTPMPPRPQAGGRSLEWA